MTPERILTYALALGLAFVIVTGVYDKLVLPIDETITTAIHQAGEQ